MIRGRLLETFAEICGSSVFRWRIVAQAVFSVSLDFNIGTVNRFAAEIFLFCWAYYSKG